MTMHSLPVIAALFLCCIKLCTAKTFLSTPLPCPLSREECLALGTPRSYGGLETFSAENKICFVSSLFVEKISDSDVRPPIVKIDDPAFDYIIFTNEERIIGAGWRKFVITDLPYKRMVTNSRLPKFMAWLLPVTSSCRVFFYGDAIYSPIPNATVWKELATSLIHSRAGIMQMPNPHIHCERCNKIFMEMQRASDQYKDSPENMAKTKKWMESQAFWKEMSEEQRLQLIPYQNTYFGYDPSNELFRNQACSFWETYATETLSFRDQGPWSSYLAKYKMTPEMFPPGLYKMTGKRGFGGHKYALPKMSESGSAKNMTGSVSHV